MNINEFSKEVHQNAVDHGFWDEDHDITETIALIHSEWSEALEEYRSGRPMVWYAVNADCQMCGNRPVMYDEICEMNNCDEGHKPEGVAVELLDGCIRILDLFGKYGRLCNSSSVAEMMQKIKANNPKLNKDTPLPMLVSALHSFTARAGDKAIVATSKAMAFNSLEAAIGMAFFWISENGVDPEALMVRKHEFNKSRPYKHGKKC